MQLDEKKFSEFKKAVGKVIREYRESSSNNSLNKFAFEYDIDRGNLSKLERGKYSCRLVTIFFIIQALGIKFSDFAQKLEEELGIDFSLIEE